MSLGAAVVRPHAHLHTVPPLYFMQLDPDMTELGIKEQLRDFEESKVMIVRQQYGYWLSKTSRFPDPILLKENFFQHIHSLYGMG